MIEQFLLTVNQWMAGGLLLAAAGCFLWGVAGTLLSPCHIASIPLIVGYVGGQEQAANAKGATACALAFTAGLFITVIIVGTVTALLGRMLGNVGSWWTIPVGAVLLWSALGMLGVEACSLPGRGLMARIRVRGTGGAFLLGLAYGVLAGPCTFGFIAPILAVITLQQKVATGILFILLFGLGQSIPIAIAGSGTAVARRLLENSRFRSAGQGFRRAAGAAVAGLGIYFILRPFL